MNEAFIYDTARTPRGKGKSSGSLHIARPIHLLKTVLEALAIRNHLDTNLVEDVIMGCVTPVAEQGGNIAKAAAMYAGYSERVPGMTLNRFCSSGLEAVNTASAYIMAGQANLIVAGGIESMSRVPMGSDGGAWLIDPEVARQTHFIPQGISADLIATLEGFTRRDVDQFAVVSQQRAAKAWAEGRFQKSIIPVKDVIGKILLERDEHFRAETTLESLSELKPAFQQMGENFGFDSVAMQKYPSVEKINHVHHAGNSSGIVDGAAAVLVGSKEIGKRLNLKARARIKSFALTSTDPTIMLLGPGPATKMALERAHMSIKDIDLIEINEAFAAVVLRFMREFNLDQSKINVSGGAIALGHPLGATGAVLLGTLLDELERQNKSTGLVTLCIGGGMGIATIIERV
ncbi:MAG: acetyl-CoA acetyltransferase [Bdellovibrionales bacterium GWA2_49_15]|nr:MAG: acetyl-CoA acetyltransferase [Bdellovibrionales bacterium GWA2_49_15]HAZ12903.1 acetyl-CoA C-acetyltransferase [Bdellovibrionales bacterium]